MPKKKAIKFAQMDETAFNLAERRKSRKSSARKKEI